MADSYEQGYDDTRFEGPVGEDLLCSICQGVLRNARTCQNKEHPFCLSCISQHLRNSHTCPECREHLTPETLKDPPRFLKNTLSRLKIKCDYSERGCPDYVQLENLQNHVERCGFAPVMCGNEGCGMVVNKRDKEIHERDLCQFRIPKCHDCKDIKKNVDELKASKDETKESQDEIKKNVDEMKASQDEIKKNVDEMKASQDEMMIKITGKESEQVEINVEVRKMKKNVDDIKARQDEIMIKITGKQSEQAKINIKVNKIEANVDEIKQTQTEMKADQVMFKAEVNQQFQRMTEMLNELLQGRNANNNGAQAIDPAVPVNQQDIIIIGGYYAPGEKSVLKTVEKYNIAEGKSTLLPTMNLARARSASCVYNGDVIVTGGRDGEDGFDSIEILKMNQHPLRWTMFNVKLLMKLSAHDLTVYKDNLYITGGHNWNEKKTSDIIYKQSLTPPYSVKRLATMPQPRRNHKAEIVNGKLFILGGSTAASDDTDSVIMYDFIKNEIKPCPSLPKPVTFMSTVAWGNMIILVGGLDNDQVLNDVIMYDTETGRSERLPSLKHKRYGASAVIMHDVIVVLGGYNEEGYLNSVESFTMGDDQWKELPGMKEKRFLATAVVKRQN